MRNQTINDFEATLEAAGMPDELPEDPLCPNCGLLLGEDEEDSELETALTIADVDWDQVLFVAMRHPKEFRDFIRKHFGPVTLN